MTTTPTAQPAVPTLMDEFDALLARRRGVVEAEQRRLLQPWLDRAEPHARQIEPLRRELAAVRQTWDAEVRSWKERLKQPEITALRGHRMGDTVADTARAVDDWLGYLTTALEDLTTATRAWDALPTVPVPHREQKTETVITYVGMAAEKLVTCRTRVAPLQAAMVIILAAYKAAEASGNFAPDRGVELARKYQPRDPEAA